MSKTLIIAEKPSVATDLARVLAKVPGVGKFEKLKDSFENDTMIITSAVGHLVELKMPTTEAGKKLPWGFKHLPVIPDQFELQPIEKSETRLKAVLRMAKKKEVTEIINACDAGREGELIFRYLMEMGDIKKPVKRLWMQSMTDGSILDAYSKLRDDSEMRPLANAAICRSESDWLIGLNGTRALTAYNSRNGGFNVTTAGRVQTPTLTILAGREVSIREFVSEPYFEVHGDFNVKAGEYHGRWFDENFKKDDENKQKRPERIWSSEDAQAIRTRCEGKIGTVEENKKPTKQAPPQLFDLTSLQREAGNRFGYSARRTLQLAQALYERYKLLTYPRTDSKFLPEDYIDEVKNTITEYKKGTPNAAFPAEWNKFAGHILSNNLITPTKRIFDNKKVSDHFAIIPTGKLPGAAVDPEAAKLYDFVVRRFLAVFYPSAEFMVTQRVTRIEQDTFRTDGRVLVTPGYLEVWGRKPGVASGKDELVAAEDGEKATNINIEVKAEDTKPPARFTETTLLSAMETAGKLVDDGDLREAMGERGLGTPATRAAIIEGLINQKYIFRDERSKRDLVVSNKGLALIELIQKIGIKTLSSPEMTGEWEYKLKLMEQGKLGREEFMNEIKTLAKKIVDKTIRFTETIANQPFPDLQAKCPECGADNIKQTDGTYECRSPDCSFRITKYIASHELTDAEARQLVTTANVGPIDTFKSRFGQPFTAMLTLNREKKGWKLGFVFEGDEERSNEVTDLTDEQIICEAPDENGKMVKIYENERAFLAPEMGKTKDDRGIRISKTILKKEIPTEQGIKLFQDGKTDLIPGFISKKNRPFSAHILLDRKTGKISWEFAPRAAKKVAAKKVAAKKEEEKAE
jgi:DNA topoisomerase-3